ncbi:MAG: type IV toxin-antitoxin system AbiEi family antitoxin domain-containing protein [Candidatus Dormibacteraceae bacterium]
MGDKKAESLFELAEGQGGFFTAAQARGCGYSWALLSHHVRSGRLLRVRRGLYRLRQYPSSPRDEVLAAWLAAGRGAFVSHESALDLLGLGDTIPNSIHITIPRARRRWRPPADVSVHTAQVPPDADELVERRGILLTSPTRTLLDVAQSGTDPEQVSLAIRQAVDRGLVTRDQLLAAAHERGRRVEAIVAAALRVRAN